MIDPRYLHGRGEEHLELRLPHRALHRQESRLKIAQPIGMKTNMLGFVLENERASLFQHRIARPRLQQPVIGCADKFCDNQKLNFKFESEGMAGEPKERVRPMVFNCPAPEPAHQSSEQSGVFLFLSDEQSERLVIRNVIRRFRTSLREQEGSLPRFTQLKMRQRTGQNVLSSLI